MLYKKATKKSCKKALKKKLNRHDKPDSWDVNISFNLGQSENGSSMVNANVES